MHQEYGAQRAIPTQCLCTPSCSFTRGVCAGSQINAIDNSRARGRCLRHRAACPDLSSAATSELVGDRPTDRPYIQTLTLTLGQQTKRSPNRESDPNPRPTDPDPITLTLTLTLGQQTLILTLTLTAL